MTATLVLEKTATPAFNPVVSPNVDLDNGHILENVQDFSNFPLPTASIAIDIPDNMEWVNGQFIEKTGMAKKHSVIQARLSRYWGNYLESAGQGGEVMTEASCRTLKQVRRPDVAYISADLAQELGDFIIADRPFSLIAEIASPDDIAESLFAKAEEYIEAGCLEVWLLFPQAKFAIVKTNLSWSLFNHNQVISTQNTLTGFNILLSDLLA